MVLIDGPVTSTLWFQLCPLPTWKVVSLSEPSPGCGWMISRTSVIAHLDDSDCLKRASLLLPLPYSAYSQLRGVLFRSYTWSCPTSSQNPPVAFHLRGKAKVLSRLPPTANQLSLYPRARYTDSPWQFLFLLVKNSLQNPHTHTRCLAWFGHPLPCPLLRSDLPGLIHSGTLSCSTLLPQVTSEGAERGNILFASLHRNRDLCPTRGSAGRGDRETGSSPSLLQTP